ncbi:MAG TPA: SDR family oxidoreductase [Thermoanaerobaculia bacterium]|nr:SDR family oxidoreductase [Thermoanaerobaculia bacterium]
MDLGIRGRVAMVAAASKGLGRGVAEALAAEGCRLSICSRSVEHLDEARQAIEQAGGEVLAAACDVSSPGDLQRWVEATTAKFGQVDIVVTNTGGPPAAKFLQLTDEQWRAGVESTLMNVVRLCRLVIPGMQARKWGRIVNLTSLVAKQPLELLTISSTLRAGLSALTKTLADQVARDNILVNAVLPGHVLTDRQVHLIEIRSKELGISTEEYARRVEESIPMGRFGRADEIGSAVAFLCSEHASYITGASLQVDGGIIRSTF